VVAGTAILPVVRVGAVDAKGNEVPLHNIQVTIVLDSPNVGDTLRGQTTTLMQQGTAFFNNLTLNKTSTGVRLAAVATHITGALSTPFNVNPGPASKVEFTVQPSEVVAGEAMSPAVKVEVQDSKGNKVPSFTGAVRVFLRTGTPGGDLINNTVSAVAGEATFSNLKFTKSGPGYTIGAIPIQPGITEGTSGVFEVKAGAANRLAFRVGPLNNLANAVFSPALQVAVTDTLDNTVTTSNPSITLALSSNPNAAILRGALTATASNGIAVFQDISVDRQGVNYRISASATGLLNGFSSFFSIASSGFSLLAPPEHSPETMREAPWRAVR
jgi:hypothetical protein